MNVSFELRHIERYQMRQVTFTLKVSYKISNMKGFLQANLDVHL